MRRANLSRSASSWAGAFLTLLAWALSGHQAARAQCTSHSSPIVSLSVGSGTLDLGERVAPVGANEIPGRPKPCTGEMCSGRPAVPLSPATSEIRRVASWAILAVTTRIAAPDRADRHLDPGGARPIHSPTSIFHPPRHPHFTVTS
jgi:hypothetical protein